MKKKSKWFHVSIVKKGKEVTMFIDGKKEKNFNLSFWVRTKTLVEKKT